MPNVTDRPTDARPDSSSDAPEDPENGDAASRTAEDDTGRTAITDGGRPVPSWVSLDADEQLLWVGRRSLWTIARSILVAAVLTLAAGLFAAGLPDILPEDAPQIVRTALPAIALLAAALIAVHAVAVHRSVTYALTENEVYEKTGVLSDNITQIPLQRVQNTEMNLSLTDRLLGYGDVTIRTAGTDAPNVVLRDIPDPRTVHEMVLENWSSASNASSAAV